MPKELSTTEAAELLQVSRQRVLQLIDEGRLEARKIGNFYAITLASVEVYKATRKGAEDKK